MVKTIGKLRNVNYTNSSHLQTGTLGEQHHLSKKYSKASQHDNIKYKKKFPTFQFGNEVINKTHA